MRRCLLGIVLAALLLVAGCGSSHPPTHLWTTTNTSRFAADPSYGVQLNWAGVTIPSITGYFLTLNGTQQADLASTATSYQFTGLDCGTAYTLGVQAHNGSGGTSTAHTTTYTTPDCPSGSPFPLRVAASGRTLETANGDPFLMVGDSPQSMIGNLSVTSMDSYLDDREAQGFNTVWANVLCDDYTFCNANGQAVGDGSGAIKPFSTGSTPSNYDLSTPNSTYFSRVHTMVAHAAADNLEVILDPIETGGCQGSGWMDTLSNNGNGTTSTSTKDYQYGQFLGTTFGDLDNVIWMSGNDFQCIGTTADNNDAISVAEGIENTDPGVLQTLEPDACGGFGGDTCQGTSSLHTESAATGWASTVALNATYSYAPTYAEDRAAYGQSSTQPMFTGEANYDGESLGSTDGGTDQVLRLQEWWTMTVGGTGNLYGCGCTDRIAAGWTTGGIDTTGVAQLKVQADLLNSIDWQDLVPDTNGSGHLITSGGGTCPTTGSMASVTCVTAAETGDDKLAVVYDPQGNTITVDLTKMSGSTTARWFDPTDGTFSSISGSPFANTGSHSFASPGTNGDGDNDWVLLLQAP